MPNPLIRIYDSMPLPVTIRDTTGGFACAIASPAPGASCSTGTPVAVTINTSLPATSVDFRVNGVSVGAATGAGTAWTYSWTPASGDVGSPVLSAMAVAAGSFLVTTAPGVTVSVATAAAPAPTGTDFAALAAANGLTTVGYWRADFGLSGASGSGFASWTNLSGSSSAITPDGTATNGIGTATAGLGGRAGLVQNGATQKGTFTAPVLAAPGTTNWHRYWIARQSSTGVSGAARKFLSETGDAYKIEAASTTVIYAYGAGPSGSPGIVNDTWERGRVSYTGSTTGEFKLGSTLVTGGTGGNTAPATTRQFGDLLSNWEWLMMIEVTGTKANFLAFATAADAAAQSTWTNAIQI